MGKREYFVGDQIKADGDYYTILGKITYRNKADGKTWDEYRLKSVQFSNEERWLSVDEFYNEYSISRVDPTAVSLTGVMGYHLVDSGIEQVIATSGDVGDVVVGDTARFEEYEDNEEEKIVSVEDWDDGTEYSRGYYLDPWEFGKDGESQTMQRVKGNIGNIITGIELYGGNPYEPERQKFFEAAGLHPGGDTGADRSGGGFEGEEEGGRAS